MSVPIDIPDPNLSLEDMVKAIYLKVNSFDTAFKEQQKKIASLEEEVSSLNKQVRTLQNIVNNNEQEKRSLSLRVNGVVFNDEEKADPSILSKRVYDKVLQPILTLAKASKILDRVPTLPNTIVTSHRIRASSALTGTASPPLSSSRSAPSRYAWPS